MVTDTEVVQANAKPLEVENQVSHIAHPEEELTQTTPETSENIEPEDLSHATVQTKVQPGEAAEASADVKSRVKIKLQTLKDGRIIPLGKTEYYDNFRVLSDDTEVALAEGSENGKNVQYPTFYDRRCIYLELKDDNSYVLPFQLCQQWKDMKELIKIIYEDNEVAKRQIDEGNFKISKYRSKILPSHWSHLIEPWSSYRLYLNSEDSSEDSDRDSIVEEKQVLPTNGAEAEEEEINTLYKCQVKYRVDYYVKARYSGDDDEFLFNNMHDDPVVIENKRIQANELSVLEEVKNVIFKNQERAPTKEKVSKKAPKLEPGDTVGEKKLHVRSPFLLNVLRSVVKYSSNPPTGDETDVFREGIFPYPFRDLYHHKEELIAYIKDENGGRKNHSAKYNAECDNHIDLLLKYLDNEPSIQLPALEARWNKKIPTTTFAGFWLLMKPGSDVYVEEKGQLNAYVVDMVFGGVNYATSSQWAVVPQVYTIRVWNLVYDGRVIRRMAKIIEVPVFDGEREILSLPVFPTGFQDRLDGGARRKQLIERGTKYFKYSQGPAFLEYSGFGLKPGWKKYNRARVVVEHESRPWENAEDKNIFNTDEVGESARGAHCECHNCDNLEGVKEKYVVATFSDYDEINTKETKELSEHQYFLCQHFMFAFILKDRVYDRLDVSGLHEPKIVVNAIDQLVMRPESNKSMIKAIVKTYADSNGQNEFFRADFIRGKGEGQIFLLHGPPGTGKTLTAESVAEFTSRPLLSITAADLGHEPVDLEKNLLRFFKNAMSWDAIVLLDEADVYLERRSTNDLRRNSIVSIFLRALEYFQGILFLTTNRVGHFDEAFMSRIHVSIGYEPLDDDARGKIWEGLFRKLKTDHKNGGQEIRAEYEAKMYVQKNEDVLKLKWNGREIRNAFQTAVALAVYDSKVAIEKGATEEDAIPQVTEMHLTQVVNMSSAFKKYIKDTHEGMDDGDYATKLGNRADNTKPNMSRKF